MLANRYRKETMPSILIKNPPPDVYDWLKASAARERRSLNQQSIFCLERCMQEEMAPLSALPPPLLLASGPLSYEDIDRAKRSGRK